MIIGIKMNCQESIDTRICITCGKQCTEKEGFVHSSYGWCCGIECYKVQLAERTELIRKLVAWEPQKLKGFLK